MKSKDILISSEDQQGQAETFGRPDEGEQLTTPVEGNAGQVTTGGPQVVEESEQEQAGAAEGETPVDTLATAQAPEDEPDGGLLSELLQKYPDAPPIHPLASLFPFLNREDFAELVADIKSHGLRHKISLVDGQIFDGRTRYFACREAGVDLLFEQWVGSGDLLADVVSLNSKRRHLNESQRALVAAKLLPLIQQQIAEETKAANPGKNGANLHRNKKAATKKVAKDMKVSPRSIQHGEKVLASGKADVIAKVEAGELAVSRADKEINQKNDAMVLEAPTDDVPISVSADLATQSSVLGCSEAAGSVASASESAPNEHADHLPSGNLFPAQQLLLSWPGLNDLLRQAEELVETPMEQLKSQLVSFNPATDDLVMDDDPRFHWTKQDHTEELSRNAAYISALKDIEGKLAYQLAKVRKQKRSLEGHYERLLEDQATPLCLFVKKYPASDKGVQEDVPPEPVPVEGA